jgi:hypothetical protein
MEKIRAEILSSEDPDFASARILISADPAKIFDLLARPSAHHLFDGSGTVQGAISGPERLSLGARFGMSMRIKIPYRISNTVVEFEEDRLISWCHMMKWKWSYQLEDLGGGQTLVTESFDARNIAKLASWWFHRTTSAQRNAKWMAKSLVKLKLISET